VILTKWKW